MTIHAPNTITHAWHCDHGCTGPRSSGAGYPSGAAAAQAERRHNTQAHHASSKEQANA